ncbi:TonB-dependent receptor [Ventosimonas gracilis]|uniref:TonB-dependent receptor n=1 Tax=Ventosimonas gracilis TaxID=1680762 RepID=A0A139SXG9_9GAMM|nr:TonB-dependent receptor [Ventosimonas gracilis]KXU39295.1 TonB-dependent receptor [Ventosimonas gracilis]
MRTPYPALLLLISASAAAESSVELAPVVISGSRSEASGFDLPFSVDSVNTREIKDGQPAINASEVLQRVPGLLVQNRQNYAQDLQISSRGFGARSAFGVRGIKLIADGIPASTPDGQGQAATFDLDSAERIEVLRGPMATLYGSNTGGVIQLFSRDGEGAPKLSAGSYWGSGGLNKQLISTEGGNAKAGFVLKTSRVDTNGYRKHSSALREQNFAKLTLHPDDKSRIALIYSDLNQQSKDPQGLTWNAYQTRPRSAPAVAFQYNTRKSIDHQQLGLNYQRWFGDARVQATFYQGKRRVVQYLAIPPGAQLAATHSGGVVDFERRFHGSSVRWLQPVASLPGEFEWIAGIDYDKSTDDRQGYENFVGGQLGVKGRLRRDESDQVESLDPYLQASWQLGDFRLQAGVRHNTLKVKIDDRYLANGDDSGRRRFRKATPVLGLLYAFTPELHGYFSAGKGFETPTLGEMAYAPTGGFNLSLRPSTSIQLESGLKAQLGRTRLNAALFQIKTRDEITVASNNGGRTSYQNATRTLRRGLELSLNSELTDQLSAQLAYTRLSATYQHDFMAGGNLIRKGRHLPGVAGQTLYGELALRPFQGGVLAVEGFWRSKLYVEDSNLQKAAPGYSQFNLRARSEQSFGALSFGQTLRVDNLFGKRAIGSVIVGQAQGRYYEPAPRRTVYAGLDMAFRF